ncbi:MAG: hypothetical protein U0167_07750 [bacterium]
MTILQIEHPVPDFDSWKKAFDSDPAHRRKNGVRRYRVMRSVENPNYVLVDLEFDSTPEAEAFRTVLQSLWRRVEGKVMESPRARVVETVETKDL